MAGTKSFTVFTKFAVKNGMTGPVLGMAKSADKLAMRLESVKQGAAKVGKGAMAIGKGFMGVAVAAGAAAVAVGALVNGTQNAADDIQNTANALGLTTKALQEYRYVGIQAGLTTQDMDAALTKLTKNIGNGSADVDEALSKIGLTAEQLRAAGPDKTLELVADGFQRVKDPSVKAAVAMSLFGKSSVRMVNALESGSAGIKGLRTEAEDIGYVMGGDTLKNAGDLNDQLDKLGATAVGLRNRLSSKAIPGVQKMVEWLQKGIQPGGMLDKMLDSLGNTVGKLGTAFGPVMDKVLAFIPKLVDFVGTLAETLTPLFGPLADIFGNIFQIVENLMPLIQTLAGVAAAVLKPILELVNSILGVIAQVTGKGAPAAAAPTKQDYGKSRALGLDKNGQPMTPMSANTIPLSTSSSTSNTSTSRVELSVAPGVNAKQDKPAPGVTLNTAPAGRRAS